MKQQFITTAIDYTNSAPHIGHAYEKILADVIARYKRQKGEEVFFLTGVDQHGQKVQQSAEKENLPPQEFADIVSKGFVDLWKELGISYDEWAATSNPKHKKVVQEILNDLKDKGWIYKDIYKGPYSIRQEQFLTDKERNEKGEFGEEWGEVINLEEENWYFRLSKCSNWLINFIEKQEDFVTPSFRQKELKNAANNFTGDLCITRPKNRLSWGIEVPFDKDFVTYVWFDALINYISFAGYKTNNEEFEKRWENTQHIIGKDILAPAHGVYWPCMLHALGFTDKQIPKLLVHGFWTLNKNKISKSTGNIINPTELIKNYGATALRYYLMREATTGYDADFNETRLIQRYNTELGNGLGNLLNRTLAMAKKYRDGSPENKTVSTDLIPHIESTKELCKEYVSEMDKFNINSGLEAMTHIVNNANALIDKLAPWKVAKEKDQEDRLDSILTTLLFSIQTAATMLAPVAPEAAKEIFRQLNMDTIDLMSPTFILPPGYKCQDPTPIFLKLISAEEEHTAPIKKKIKKRVKEEKPLMQ